MAQNEQYLVSARKYRPQTFDTVIGQEHITTTLKNAIKSGHLAHAYLFCGPRGVGKTTCARIFARTLNCENPTEDMEACGVCETCKAFQNNSSLNIFELDAASNNSVEDIRRLNEQVRYAPQHGKYKIYIIDEVHMLSASAFNAFLKTLEEPPSYAIFILATTEKHKILPTILSRCQVFDFKRIAPAAIVHHLEDIIKTEGLSAEEEGLHIIAQQSEGCMRDALSIMDRLMGFANGKLTYEEVITHLNILDATSYFKLSEMLWVKDVGGALLFLDELLQKGFEGNLIINGFLEYFRNLLLCRDGKMAKLLEMPETQRKGFYKRAQLVPDAYIVSALNILNTAELNYKNAINKRLHVELSLIKLAYLTDVIPVNELGETALQPASSPLKKKYSGNEVTPNSNAGLESESGTPKQESVITSGTQKVGKSDIAVNENKREPAKVILENPATPPPSSQQPEGQTGVVNEPAGTDLKDNKIPEPSQSAESANKTQQTSNPSGGLKLTGDFLKKLQAKNAVKKSEEEKDLTKEELENAFEAFKLQQKEDKNIIISEQLELVKLEIEAKNEIKILCSSNMNESYIRNIIPALRDFIQESISLPRVIIKTSVDTHLDSKPKEVIKSQQEILDEFSEKNKALKKLRDGLNLSIDY